MGTNRIVAKGYIKKKFIHSWKKKALKGKDMGIHYRVVLLMAQQRTGMLKVQRKSEE